MNATHIRVDSGRCWLRRPLGGTHLRERGERLALAADDIEDDQRRRRPPSSIGRERYSTFFSQVVRFYAPPPVFSAVESLPLKLDRFLCRVLSTGSNPP